MLDVMLKFVEACRAGNLRVSTAEVIDCVRQLQLVDVLEEGQFKAALRANFAKSRREQRNFDRVYHLFFHDVEPGTEAAPERGRAPEMENLLEALSRQTEDDPISRSLLDFLSGDPIGYLAEIQRVETQQEYSTRSVKSNLGQLSSRLEIMLRINRARNRLVQLQGGNDGPGTADAAHYLKGRLDNAARMLSEETKPYNDALKQVRTHEAHYKGLGERPFASLSEVEIAEMRVVIEHLVRKMKDIMTRRYASRNKGSLDVKKTLRHAGRFQGIPIEIKYRNRPLRKTKIITLCDVSGSVWSAARFMLNMIYSLQDCFSDVKSFAFVCSTVNITDIFEKHDVNQAIEKVVTDTDINLNALTDYGEMFHQFHRDYLHLLTQKTTLIIVGDGRSNYHNPRELLLEEMRARCRRVIWLNPEPEEFWGTGDSEMNTYKAYCHEVRPCRNLNQLIDFVEELVF